MSGASTLIHGILEGCACAADTVDHGMGKQEGMGMHGHLVKVWS